MKIEPCPFCGCNEVEINLEWNGFFSVSCVNCDASCPDSHLISQEVIDGCADDLTREKAKMQAIRKWNRRQEPVVSKMESSGILKEIDSVECPAEFNKIFGETDIKDLLA